MYHQNKRRKYIALELYADPAYWDEAGEQFIILRNLKGAEQKAENKQREADNALLAKYKVRARETSNVSRSKASTGR